MNPPLHQHEGGEEIRERLFPLYYAPAAARALQVAAILDVFGALDERPRTAREMAEATATNQVKMEALLDACCALGLLSKQGWIYRNTPLSEKALLRRSPLYQGHLLRHFYDLWDYWTDFLHVVRTGSTSRPLLDRATPWRSVDAFIRGMHAFAVTGQAGRLVERVSLEGRRRLLDLGGGAGSYSIAFCERYPDLEAVVYDLPDVVRVAASIVEEYGLSERVRTIAGDFFADDVTGSFDVVLLSQVLHGPRSHPHLKLEHARNALSPGGLLIVADFVRDPDGTGPEDAALFNLWVGAYKEDDLLRELRRAGFREPKLQWRDRGQAVITAEG